MNARTRWSLLSLALLLAPSAARAQAAPAAPVPTPTAEPPTTPTTPTTPTSPTTTTEPTTTTAPTTTTTEAPATPPAEAAPAPAPAPAPEPTPATTTTTTTTTSSGTTTTTTAGAPPPAPAAVAEVERERTYDYYSRARGLGIFHKLHIVAGLFVGEAPQHGEAGAMPSTEELSGATGGLLLAEATFLEGASIYGNFQGLEGALAVRSGPWDFDWHMGMPFTILNLGRGGIASLRLGASFGFGLGLRHAYAYVKGRAAMVIVPEQLDVEASVLWVPESASAAYDGVGDLEDVNARVSAFWRRGGGAETAWEVYVEMFERDRRGHDAAAVAGMAFGGLDVRDELRGYGAGVGYVW